MHNYDIFSEISPETIILIVITLFHTFWLLQFSVLSSSVFSASALSLLVWLLVWCVSAESGHCEWQ